jgi:T5orf172 domain
MAGFVYVLSNPSLPQGTIKIGMSDRDPKLRAEELYTTGVPTRFHVEYYAFVENPQDVERAVHKLLADVRVSDSREFFMLSLDSAVSAIRKVAIDIKYEEYSDKRPVKVVDTSTAASLEINTPNFDVLSLAGLKYPPLNDGKTCIFSYCKSSQLSMYRGYWMCDAHRRDIRGRIFNSVR